MEEYATSLNLTYNQIRTWFAERRRKEKRENEALSNSKSSESVEPESDQSNNSALFAVDRHVGQKDKRSAPIMHRKDISDQGEIKGHTSLIHDELQNPESTCLKKRFSADYPSNQLVRRKDRHKISGQRMKDSVGGRKRCAEKKHLIHLQVLFSKEFVLTKIFRKDGPPLGVQFDPPANALGYPAGMPFSP